MAYRHMGNRCRALCSHGQLAPNPLSMKPIKKLDGPHVLMAVIGFDHVNAEIGYRLIPVAINDPIEDIGSGLTEDKAIKAATDQYFNPIAAFDVEAGRLHELKQAAENAMLEAAANGYLVK